MALTRPLSSKTRNSSSATWMVTTWRAWEKPTWTRSPATWTWPRCDTRRRTTTGPLGTSSGSCASLAPWSPALAWGGTGDGSDRTRTPSASTCSMVASNRTVTVWPARAIPAATCRPATPSTPLALTRRSASTAWPGSNTTAYTATPPGDGPAGPAAASRPRASCSAPTRHGSVFNTSPSRLTCIVMPSRRTVTVRPPSRRPSHTCRPATPRFPHAGTGTSSSTGSRPRAAPASGPTAAPGPAGRVATRPARVPTAALLDGAAAPSSSAGTHRPSSAWSGSGSGLRWNRSAGVCPSMVVVVHPRVDDLLGDLDAGQRPDRVEQFLLQRLVEPLHLPRRGRRAHRGQPLGDPVLPQDPLEQHLGRARLAEPTSELLAVVGQQLLRHPIAPQRRHQRPAHRPASRPRQHRRADAVARVVVHPGQHLGLCPTGQPNLDQVHLPQLHRPLPLPAFERTLAAPTLRLDQPVADQQPPDPSPRRQRRHPTPLQLVQQPLWPPARVRPAQLAHPGLDGCWHLVRAARRPVRAVRQALQPALAVPVDPGVDRLARHPVALRNPAHRQSRLQHLDHGVVALLDHAPLPQHLPASRPRRTNTADKQTERSCQASPETPVKHQPKPIRQASPEPAHRPLELVVTTFSTPSSGGPARGARARRARPPMVVPWPGAPSRVAGGVAHGRPVDHTPVGAASTLALSELSCSTWTIRKPGSYVCPGGSLPPASSCRIYPR